MIRRQFTIIAAALITISCLPRMYAQDDFESFNAEDMKKNKKRPGYFHKAAKATAAKQLKYANSLLTAKKKGKAEKQFRNLVYQWHDSKEAPIAQQKYAKLLEERGKYLDAFDEYQYLIDNFSGKFPHEQIIEEQFKIANLMMTAKSMHLFDASNRAIPLFEQVVKNGPNWKNASLAQFNIGWINEKLKSYDVAIDAYTTCKNKYPKSDYAADASFRMAYCLYIQSNKRPRDETVCSESLVAFSKYVSTYYSAPNVEEAKGYIDELMERLAGMYYDRATFYDRLENRQKASLIAYKDFVKKFPKSKLAEQAVKRIKALKAEVENEDE